MSTAANPVADYEALARQAGSVAYRAPGAPRIDYEALARQAGAIPDSADTSGTDHRSAGPAGRVQRFLGSLTEAAGIPTRLGTLGDAKQAFLGLPRLPVQLGGAMNEAADVARARLARPGFTNKLLGGLEAVESDVPVLGPQLVKAHEQILSGDTAGGLGTTAGAAVPLALPEATGLARAGATGLLRLPAKIAAPSEAAARLVPEAAGLPEKALAGSEKVFRAAAPTAMDQEFRANLYAAAPDLSQIARETPIETKGGFVRPDLRVREFVNNADEHLHRMYQDERAPQIARNAKAQAPVELNVDSAEAAKWLSRNLGTHQARALAGRLLDPERGSVLSLADADALARDVNKELLRYERMSPSEQAAARVTSRRLAGLKQLDRSLSDTINGELERRGEPGVRDYERRYAALKSVRDTAAKRMNAVEAQRFLDRLREWVTVRNVGFSAGRAMIGGTGRTLAKGMRQLGEAGIEPARYATTPPLIRGKLGPARATLITPEEAEYAGAKEPRLVQEINRVQGPERRGLALPPAPETRAARLLPPARRVLVTPEPGYSTPTAGELEEQRLHLQPAARGSARGKGGRFTRVFYSFPKTGR